MSVHLLATKLFIPPPQPKAVLRPRLIKQLDECLHCKLTIISAPAGFGKTTLVSEWIYALKSSPLPRADGLGVRSAWLSLDDSDGDLTRFLAYLVGSLQTLVLNEIDGVATNFGEGVLGMLQSPQPPPTASILTTLLNEITAIPEPFIMVLDDYHIVDSKPVDDALTFLLEHLPPQMHLVIITREDPALPLARLRARGQLTELRAADLRFSPTEATEFLNKVMGLHLSAVDIAALETRTEGWIAGLQLAALALQAPLALQGQQDITRFIHSFTGSHRFVLDYLVEEVLQRQPEDIRNFLLQTSVLKRMNASLCEAVTEESTSQSILEILERGNLFIIPLDHQRQWYRYHHLFAEVLRAHLAAEWPDLAPTLHRRASEWYEQNNLPADAIHHALAAEDWERAAGLIELAHPAMDISYQSATWLAWAKSLPGELIRERPVLCLDIAWALLDGGEMEACEAFLQNAERWLAAVANSLDDDQQGIIVDKVQYRSLPASIATARAYRSLALGDIPVAVQYAEHALTVTPEDDPIRNLQAVSLLGIAQYSSGDLEAAELSLAAYYANLQSNGDFMTILAITYLLAEIRVGLGRLREAEYAYQQALQLSTKQGEHLPVGTSDLYRGLSEIACEQGSLEIAAGYLQTAQKLGEQASLTGWQHRLCVAQARLTEAQGDLEGALALLDEAERVYVQAPLPEVHPVPALKSRIWIKQGRLDKALAWAQTQGLSVSDELSFLRECEHITFARILITTYSQDQVEDSICDVIDFLSRLLKAAEAGGRVGSLIEILVIQALAYQIQGDTARAIEILTRALVLAQPEGYVRTFVDEGVSMMVLLREAAKSENTADFAHQLLAAFRKDDDKTTLANRSLIEPLSERELDVLKMLGSDLSGPEIARQLMVSLNTLRTHTKNIYNKLGVNNRRAAVHRARDLNLF